MSCQAQQMSDSMVCSVCEISWDVNDPDPPTCLANELVSIGKTRMQAQKQLDAYADLREALDAAYEQSASGKGKERHANDRAFTDQPILRITELVGHGFPLGQAIKKAQEASGMVKRDEIEAARAELLGAVVYLAAAWVHLGRSNGEDDQPRLPQR